jgi:hypothetical protein
MNRKEHLLSILAEECAEVAQQCSKALRFGLGNVEPGQELTNGQRIACELNDLFAAVDMLIDAQALSYLPDLAAIDAKKAKVEKFLLYSIECGTLNTNAP